MIKNEQFKSSKLGSKKNHLPQDELQVIKRLQKKQIESFIIPFIPLKKREFSCRFSLVDIFKCIVYKLKTGSQWQFYLWTGILFSEMFSAANAMLKGFKQSGICLDNSIQYANKRLDNKSFRKAVQRIKTNPKY